MSEVFGYWQIGGVHAMESDNLVAATFRYAKGAIGVIQASTALWPGYPERNRCDYGRRADAWDVQEEQGGRGAPVAAQAASGASDPMAISLAPYERQFLDFAMHVTTAAIGRAPGRMAFVLYNWCKRSTGRAVREAG